MLIFSLLLKDVYIILFDLYLDIEDCSSYVVSIDIICSLFYNRSLLLLRRYLCPRTGVGKVCSELFHTIYVS